MTADRLAWMRVRGFRSLADVRVDLGGLTVLIGENGSGKSSLVEAFEILCKLGRVQRDSMLGDVLTRVHGGLEMLLRKGAPRLELNVGIEPVAGTSERLEYSFALRPTRNGLAVDEERLAIVPPVGARVPIIDRSAASCEVYDQNRQALNMPTPPPSDLALHFLIRNYGAPKAHPAALRVIDVLTAGEVHLPFETRPLWLSAEREWPSPLRDLAVVNPATHLERLGGNLTNCYAELKNSDRWDDCLDFLKLTIGPDLRDVWLAPAARGKLELQLKFTGLGDPVSVATLSDGNLATLAFAAIFFMERDRSFLVIDEPESHLHPAVIARITAELEGLAQRVPVVVATQSDRLLDALSEPEKSALVCALDPKTRATEVQRLDAKKLLRWKDHYAGLGSIRAGGLMELVTAEANAE